MSDKKIKIMILDDEQGIVDVVRRIFSLRGYEVLTTTNGKEAIEIYKANRPEITILDVFLVDQDIDGIGVLDQIKKVNADAVCLMLSRVTDKEKIKKALELGAKHYIEKPFEYNNFVQTIELIKNQFQNIK